ncbi:MAG: SLBB domain-containing protein [Bacteroidetes bacterium]|nr:SLBB domain-containing protein [Bacteroidota bacterium]
MKTLKYLFLLIVLAGNYFAQMENSLSNNKNQKFDGLVPISVTIGGDFIVNGTFTAVNLQRVDHFITNIYAEAKEVSAGMLNQKELASELKRKLNDYALRNIKLIRANGVVKNLDLLKFRLTGDFEDSPYLLNDDVIIFPENNIETNFIDISGAVNKSTKFLFKEGDRLSDAILFAYGLNEAYENVTQVEVSRLSNFGMNEEVTITNITDDPLLQRGDRIRVLFNENYKKAYKVLVVGEVQKPGYVYITKNNTTIKDVIEKCDGFSDNADLKRSELIRGTDKTSLLTINSIKQKYEDKEDVNSLFVAANINDLNLEKMKMARMADIALEDTSYFSIDNSLRVLSNSGLIDFAMIYSDTTEDGNYRVNDGDLIVIPELEELVYIFGQVAKPGYTNFIKNANFSDYISKAGGLGEDADEIRIIRGGSREWLTAEPETEIFAGDYIYVQKEVKSSQETSIMQTSTIISAIGTAATIVLVILQIMATK